jgi:hypothetical protein
MVDGAGGFARAKRFGDVVISTQLESEDAIHFFRARREHDDGDCGSRADFAKHVITGHAGQLEVEHDQIRVFGSCDAQSGCTIVSLVHHEPFIAQVALKDLNYLRFVLDDQHAGRPGLHAE